MFRYSLDTKSSVFRNKLDFLYIYYMWSSFSSAISCVESEGFCDWVFLLLTLFFFLIWIRSVKYIRMKWIFGNYFFIIKKIAMHFTVVGINYYSMESYNFLPLNLYLVQVVNILFSSFMKVLIHIFIQQKLQKRIIQTG